MLAPLLYTISLLPAQAEQVPSLCAAAPPRTESVEISWSLPTTPATIRRLPASHDWKQFYANWLKVKYNYQIAQLNAAYATDFTSFTDLTESDFASLDAARPAVRDDDRVFWPDLESYILAQLKPACPASVTKVAWKRSRT